MNGSGIVTRGRTTIDIRGGDISLLGLHGVFGKNDESLYRCIGNRRRTKLEESSGRVGSASRASTGKSCGGNAGRRYRELNDSEKEGRNVHLECA